MHFTVSRAAVSAPRVASKFHRRSTRLRSDKDFVVSSARYEATQTAVAIARTPGSLVVICSDQRGQYGYRGVRLSDDASLATIARATPTHSFIAQNSTVTYTLSPTELL